MICEPEDFNKYPFNIVDAEGDDTGLQQFIDTVEMEVLIEVLGRPLYDVVADNLTTEPYKTLIDGGEYVDEENHKQFYDGLKAALVPYIYAKWLEKDVQLAGTGGLEQVVPENSSNVSPATKITQAWYVSYAKFCQMFLYLREQGGLFDADAVGFGYIDFEEYSDERMVNIGTKNEFDF